MKSVVFLALCVSSTLCFNPRLQHVNKGRIIGGDPVEATEFPFMAAVYTTTSLGRYFCGGALIDPGYILTAAHCVQDAINFRIILGDVRLTSNSSHQVTINATEYAIHPDYDPETLVNNIGLIKIPDALATDEYINVISLPTAALPDNTALTSIGWGQIDDDHSGPVDGLRKVSVVALPNAHCKLIYGSQIVDNMVCAMGAYNEGTCIGDLGGPLFQFSGTEAVHVGVASFLSSNGCEALEPSGFERTFPYLDWINSVTGAA